MCVLYTKPSTCIYVSQSFKNNFFGDSLKVNRSKVLPVFLTNENIQATAVLGLFLFGCFALFCFLSVPPHSVNGQAYSRIAGSTRCQSLA